MNRFRSFEELHMEEETAVTVGKFDGLHLGHKAIERRMARSGYRTVAVTFMTSPADYLTGSTGNFGIVTREERLMVMEDDGIDTVLELPFDDRVMHMAAEDFIRMLADKLHMKLFVCGDDFRFGYQGAGDVSLLRKLARRYGFKLQVIPKIRNGQQDISSTRIREELKKGNIRKVNELLGYHYFVYSEVLHGRGLGHRLGFATLNQIPEKEKLLPPFGVYVTRVSLGGQEYTGVTNVGVKPTVSDCREVGIETHVLDFEGNLYDAFVKVDFLDYIREERKFADISALTQQIQADENYARRLIKDGKVV